MKKTNKNKTIIIDERKELKIIGDIFESVFYPSANNVIKVQNYLNKNFKKTQNITLDINGYPKFENTVVLSQKGIDLKTLDMKHLLRMLDDKFHEMIKDDNDRKKFLKQIIIDWYTNKIKNGILTVNTIS